MVIYSCINAAVAMTTGTKVLTMFILDNRENSSEKEPNMRFMVRDKV